MTGMIGDITIGSSRMEIWIEEMDISRIITQITQGKEQIIRTSTITTVLMTETDICQTYKMDNTDSKHSTDRLAEQRTDTKVCQTLLEIICRDLCRKTIQGTRPTNILFCVCIL